MTTAAGAAIAHDVNGNLIGDGVWTYAYDIDNRLKSATKAGLTAGMTYDALGRLRRMAVGANTIALLYSDKQLVAEYDGAGALQRRYVHGHSSDEARVWYEGATTGAKSWLYADHLGSVVATANSAGVSTATYTYGPFGEPGSGAGAVRFRIPASSTSPILACPTTGRVSTRRHWGAFCRPTRSATPTA